MTPWEEIYARAVQGWLANPYAANGTNTANIAHSIAKEVADRALNIYPRKAGKDE